jgi:hypothetical protein
MPAAGRPESVQARRQVFRGRGDCGRGARRGWRVRKRGRFKDEAQYGFFDIGSDDLKRALRCSRAVLTSAENVLRR